jgi:hypothetical protein
MLNINCFKSAQAVALVKPSQLLALMAVVIFTQGQAFARNSWQNYDPNQPPPQTPPPHGAVIPGTNGFVPKVTSDFWQQQLSNRIAAGTVLSGILEDNLSSLKSKRGDIFSIRLQDGFAVNGNQIVPPNSRIVGTVTDVVSAKSYRQGAPGTLSVSLQSLVLPDGRNIPFFGFIVWDPTMAKHQPSKNGKPVSDTVNKIDRMGTGLLGTIGARVGIAVARPRMFDPGEEFAIDKGEVLPVRLNKALIIQPAGQVASNTFNPMGTNMPENTLPQQIVKPTPWSPANFSSNPNGVNAPPAVPGLVGPDGQGNRMSYRPSMPAGSAPNVPGAIAGQSLPDKPLAPYLPPSTVQAIQGAAQGGNLPAVDSEPF